MTTTVFTETFKIIIDQISEHHGKAKKTHKINHHTTQYNSDNLRLGLQRALDAILSSFLDLCKLTSGSERHYLGYLISAENSP